LEEKLCQPFTVVLDVFGSTVVHELLEEGAEMYVNQENKEMYAMLLVDFWFN
jgi:HECT-domain (ubiquitin-transferase)